jgi:hypothetical protein
MGAETTGRKLGIGVRLFAKAARQGVAAAGAASRSAETARAGKAAPSIYRTAPGFTAPAAAQQIKSNAGGVARGAKRFGEAVWGPMAHTGGVLWLEITGLFFGLITLFFAQNVYRFRLSWKTGPDHGMFLLCAAVTALFAAFTVTQFYNARRKEKKRRGK